MGLTHITTDDGMKITPDNASWATPVTASESFQGERLKRKLTDYVQSMPDIITAYGGAPIEYFTIYNKGSSGPQDRLSDHVGIVQKVENGIVYTVEGNSGDSYRVNQYPVGHYEVLGYGVPQY